MLRLFVSSLSNACKCRERAPREEELGSETNWRKMEWVVTEFSKVVQYSSVELSLGFSPFHGLEGLQSFLGAHGNPNSQHGRYRMEGRKEGAFKLVGFHSPLRWLSRRSGYRPVGPADETEALTGLALGKNPAGPQETKPLLLGRDHLSASWLENGSHRPAKLQFLMNRYLTRKENGTQIGRTDGEIQRKPDAQPNPNARREHRHPAKPTNTQHGTNQTRKMPAARRREKPGSSATSHHHKEAKAAPEYHEFIVVNLENFEVLTPSTSYLVLCLRVVNLGIPNQVDEEFGIAQEPPEPPGGILAVRKPVAPRPKSDLWLAFTTAHRNRIVLEVWYLYTAASNQNSLAPQYHHTSISPVVAFTTAHRNQIVIKLWYLCTTANWVKFAGSPAQPNTTVPQHLAVL
ncbi:hypothetical protein K438DRAFT_1759947 [Mycena galopus ATCC 62051]|nr:hypothetical protein K438DRAFT_1759947 [Mycena galopus ATCC 62051]